ncbi:MAG: DUF6465 family protein [Lachnospiraceae bacterium]|nr:hypothetical protein [Dorea sp.]MEE0736797.1 DUF6465 family protein [Lachnospiraceae bacterium]
MARKKATVVTKKTGTVKTAPVKAETVKKTEPMKTSTTEKAAANITEEKQEVKTEVKAETKPEVKEETKASVEKKAPAKKAPAKKTTAKKDIKVKAVVEYYGKQVEEKDMIAAVKKAWTKSGRKVADIKTIDLYIKPEEGAVYYVINGIDTGVVAF